MNSTHPQIPLACNMNVFTPAERELHIQATNTLFQSVRNIREADSGYEFSFPSSDTIVQVAEFISRERLCCPFLEFRFEVLPDYEVITLLLTGPEGTPEFLREEFSEVFL
jgi:hypothetical protein